MSDDQLASTEERMARALEVFRRELATIRTGRASPSLVDHVQVEAYGTHVPISQVASISAPDAHLILIQPWDRHTIAAIEKGLQRSELGLNPSNDGAVVRVSVPPLNEERRLEFVKMVKHRAEEGRVAIRKVRHDDLEQLRRREREGELSEDQAQRAHAELQKTTDRFIEQVEEVARRKEAELLEV